MSDAINRAIDLSEEFDTMMEVQRNPCGAWMAIQEMAGIISALPAVQPDARIKQYEEAYQYALHLAEALRENYPPTPDFRFLGDLAGLLTQIDNMVAGLSQTAVQPDAAFLEAACIAAHDAYEAAAHEAGWATNPQSRKP